MGFRVHWFRGGLLCKAHRLLYHSTLGLKATKKRRRFRVQGAWSVDVRLPGKGNSNSHGARPVHLTITTIKWIWTSRLSLKNSLCLCETSGLLDCV